MVRAARRQTAMRICGGLAELHQPRDTFGRVARRGENAFEQRLEHVGAISPQIRFEQAVGFGTQRAARASCWPTCVSVVFTSSTKPGCTGPAILLGV